MQTKLLNVKSNHNQKHNHNPISNLTHCCDKISIKKSLSNSTLQRHTQGSNKYIFIVIQFSNMKIEIFKQPHREGLLKLN